MASALIVQPRLRGGNLRADQQLRPAKSNHAKAASPRRSDLNPSRTISWGRTREGSEGGRISIVLTTVLALTSDEHLQGIDFERLTFELQSFDVTAPVIATPREMVKKFFR